MRRLKPNGNQMLCRFGCKTIVEKELGSCEMCCDDAIAERVLRVTPIHEANQEKTNKETDERKLLLAKRRESFELEELDKATAPAPVQPRQRKARS